MYSGLERENRFLSYRCEALRATVDLLFVARGS